MKMFAFYLTYINMATNEEESEHGFICAGDFAEATAKITNLYGEEIEEIRLTMYEGFDIGVIEKDALDSAQEWFQRMEQA